MANCFKCHAPVVFDEEHIGRNGKKIPLDPSTKQPHDCPMREKRTINSASSSGDVIRVGESNQSERVDIEEKDDHGNESYSPTLTGKILEQGKETTELKSFVDHTLKGASKVKIFVNDFAPNVEAEYNDFLAKNKVKTQGAQFQFDGDAFAIALYYEET